MIQDSELSEESRILSDKAKAIKYLFGTHACLEAPLKLSVNRPQSSVESPDCFQDVPASSDFVPQEP